MCWSATADLVAGAGLLALGGVGVAGVRSRRDLPLAALPLLLGAHQIVEALVWDAGGGSGAATVVWTVIALPLLAVWVPAGVWCAAPPSARRGASFALAVGVATAVPLAYGIAAGPVTAEIRGHRVGYLVDLPYPPVLVAGYLVATVGALLLSGDRRLRALGAVAAVGAAGCFALWRLEFVSTWCAFAAVCSVLLVGWTRTPRREVSHIFRRSQL
ncbi:hypothetical protein PYK79_52430 [Streptomyces sp. ID05-04B]|uniref:DUF6629 family protein n=1 Tax=unclassified Streptomyces TaxID=2593676 RepID=UPI000D198512|nr:MULTISPECIES: DUF6629 family protein [unclassified Streptomyces]AVV43938.1 hypothetical protein C6376_23290 [Streptomyces sp. P3]MDX5570186.1 hypothetical protein [Streptomyces sp. ID05-04B]